MNNEQIKKELWNELNYWCEQYQYANNVSFDMQESERITKNIKALERVLELFK